MGIPKLLSTPAGDVELGVPKLRPGSFFPGHLEPRRRIDNALWAVIMTAYISDNSTRKTDDLVKALGCNSGISRSTVSRVCARIYADATVLRPRRRDHRSFIYVWLDAHRVHVRENRQVVSKVIVIATELRLDGHREVLSLNSAWQRCRVHAKRNLMTAARPQHRQVIAAYDLRRTRSGHRA